MIINLKNIKIRNLDKIIEQVLSGSHLIDKLMNLNQEVICLDNYFTGSKSNIKQWLGHPNFEIIRHDVTEPIQLEVDQIWYFLSCLPNSLWENPIKTAKTSLIRNL